jgi:hypothetical protein
MFHVFIVLYEILLLIFVFIISLLILKFCLLVKEELFLSTDDSIV